MKKLIPSPSCNNCKHSKGKILITVLCDIDEVIQYTHEYCNLYEPIKELPKKYSSK
jgi:hypothetical protein